MNEHQVFIIIMTGILTTAWTASRVLRPLGEALSRRLAAGRAPDVDHESRLTELATRLADLEERLDFTERVLLQERQAGELGQGGGY